MSPRAEFSLRAASFTRSLRKAMAGRYGAAIAYVAGPPPMVDGALKALIAQGGLSPRQIRYDKFS